MSLKCIKCKYDLSGLEPSSLCPECACPIADSLAVIPPRPESAAARCFHTAVLTALIVVGFGTLLAPLLKWHYGPTEYDPLIRSLQGWIGSLGMGTAIVDFANRRWGVRILVILAAALMLWFRWYQLIR
jgi:hypothetical protein